MRWVDDDCKYLSLFQNINISILLMWIDENSDQNSSVCNDVSLVHACWTLAHTISYKVYTLLDSISDLLYVIHNLRPTPKTVERVRIRILNKGASWRLKVISYSWLQSFFILLPLPSSLGFPPDFSTYLIFRDRLAKMFLPS